MRIKCWTPPKPKTGQVKTVPGPQPGQISKDLDRLVGFAPSVSAWAMAWAVSGRIGSGGGVEADRVVAAAELLQHLGKVVVDPDVARVASLGPAQHRLGRRPALPRRPVPCPSGRG